MSAYSARPPAEGFAGGTPASEFTAERLIVGNFGGKTLFDYRALGDPINTAARLESVNKHLGTRVCLAGHRGRLPRCAGTGGRATGPKGKSQPLQVYEPLGRRRIQRNAPDAR